MRTGDFQLKRPSKFGNIKKIIWAPRPHRDGGPPSTLGPVGLGTACPYRLRLGIRRYCAPAHVPVRPGAGQKIVATIVKFRYAGCERMRTHLLFTVQSGVLPLAFTTAPRGCPTAEDLILAQTPSMGSPGTAIQKHLFIVISGSAIQMRLIIMKKACQKSGKPSSQTTILSTSAYFFLFAVFFAGLAFLATFLGAAFLRATFFGAAFFVTGFFAGAGKYTLSMSFVETGL